MPGGSIKSEWVRASVFWLRDEMVECYSLNSKGTSEVAEYSVPLQFNETPRSSCFYGPSEEDKRRYNGKVLLDIYADANYSVSPYYYPSHSFQTWGRYCKDKNHLQYIVFQTIYGKVCCRGKDASTVLPFIPLSERGNNKSFRKWNKLLGTDNWILN